MLKRVLIALALLVGLGAAAVPLAERVGAHAIVDAPNQARAIPPPEPGEQRYAVGPPAATLSVAIVEAAPRPGTSSAPLADELSAPRSPAVPRGVIFLLHGIRSHKESVSSWAQQLSRAGYRAVLVDSRGHGRSTGDWLTYGVQEARDLSQLLDQMHLPPSLPVGVMGCSYGAATAIEWAGREPRVAAAVALAPFTTMRAVVTEYVPRVVPLVGRFMPETLVQAIVDRAGVLAHFDPDEASPLGAIKLRDEPLLIFHGTADRHIPLAQSQMLQARAPTHTRLVLLDGQDHNHIAGDRRLWPAVLDFFAVAFKTP
jgi:alpha-beta hydrolase superfamily lysophospholipase